MITALQYAQGPAGLLNFSRFIVALGAVFSMAACCSSSSRPAAHFLLDGARRPAARRRREGAPEIPHAVCRRRSSRGFSWRRLRLLRTLPRSYDLTNIGTLFAFVLVCRRDRPASDRAGSSASVPGSGRAVHADHLDPGVFLPDVCSCRRSRGSGSGSGWLIGLVFYFAYGYSIRSCGLAAARIGGSSGSSRRIRDLWLSRVPSIQTTLTRSIR